VHLLTIRRKKTVRSRTWKLIYVTCRTGLNVTPEIMSEPLILTVELYPRDRTRKTYAVFSSITGLLNSGGGRFHLWEVVALIV